MFRVDNLFRAVSACGLALVVSACSSWNAGEELAIGAAQTPSASEVQTASRYFKEGAYGNASKHFRIAVEKEPGNPDAWLGLAASYDRLRRFDLADRAYSSARKLKGDTAEIMNNIGYSYLLRGELGRARQFMSAAYQRNASDPRIISNIETIIDRGRRRTPSIDRARARLPESHSHSRSEALRRDVPRSTRFGFRDP